MISRVERRRRGLRRIDDSSVGNEKDVISLLSLCNEDPGVMAQPAVSCFKKKNGATVTNYMDLLKVNIGQKLVPNYI